MSKTSRRVRSFVLRQGRMTTAQQHALDNFWNEYGFNFDKKQIDWAGLFGNPNPVVMEIGFGDGDSLLQMAEQNPHLNYFGLEVHKPGVGALIKNAKNRNILNIKVCMDDAVEVLRESVADNSLSGVQIFFPDPWHKKRHNKRRLVQTGFVAMLESKVILGGFLHLATDWKEYAEEMLEVLDSSRTFSNQKGTGNYFPRPDFRPVTKFEKRGLKLGHDVWDLIYIKKNISE